MKILRRNFIKYQIYDTALLFVIPKIATYAHHSNRESKITAAYYGARIAKLNTAT